MIVGENMLIVLNYEVAFLKRAIIASSHPMSIGPLDYDREITDDDIARCQKLGSAKQGSGHDNFLSGVVVSMDVKYPEYWSPEFQRYHFAQIVSSQSKMHRILKFNISEGVNQYVDQDVVDKINAYRYMYNKVDGEDQKYYWFMKIVSNLPMGFEKIMQIVTNYLQLKTIWYQRHEHKLKEDWQPFCDWILTLPLFSELTGIEK